MSFIGEWRSLTETEMTPKEHKEFWDEYYKIETAAYKKILARKEDFYEDKYSELALEFGMSETLFAGFIDGINSSLIKRYDIEKLKGNTDISLKVDFEKLYYDMLEAKAKWLYSLTEWDDILTEDDRKKIREAWQKEKQAVSEKIGRNAPCPCGSGKKYKKCCGANS